MITVEKLGILLHPTNRTFENHGVFNPGIYQSGDTVHILYRAVQNGNYSSIGYARTQGPLDIKERYTHPIIVSEFGYEKHGVEDPRVVKIEDRFYITYTAYDGINAMGALITSNDLVHFEKRGIITPQINYQQYEELLLCNKHYLLPKYHHFYLLFKQIGLTRKRNRFLRDKDLVFFPKKINGKFAMLHRIWPGIQIVYFDSYADLTNDFWEEYIKNLADYIVLDPSDKYEMNYVGAGSAPFETEDGWLLIYHGVQETPKERIYHAKVALLDLNNPQKVLSRLPYPLFSPTEKWERKGVVDDVVFPTGQAVFNDFLYIYYGASDNYTAVAKVNLKELLYELKKLI